MEYWPSILSNGLKNAHLSNLDFKRSVRAKKKKKDASRFYQLPRQDKFEFVTFPSFLSKILAPKKHS
jgi:hypothetical protein